MDYIYSVRMPNGMRLEAVAEGDLQLRMGDYAILKREHSLEYILVLRRFAGGPATPDKVALLPRVQRVATVVDRATATENEAHAKSAFRTACQMVESMQLPMKLLNASYSFDRKLCTIQFTADGRVDFRELVKELSHALNTRLDLRQIGVRDETGITGGIAVCGQVLCCTRFMREFNSINVRMAKEQDLSLTPATISGVCGRLKCCLKFEYEGYVEMEKTMPRRGELCECAKGKGRVSDRNMLTRKVTLNLEGGGTVTLDASELKYRDRSGKPPVPEAENPIVPEVAPEAEETLDLPANDMPPEAGQLPEDDAQEIPEAMLRVPISSNNNRGKNNRHNKNKPNKQSNHNKNQRKGGKPNPRKKRDENFDRRPNRYSSDDDDE